MHPVILSIGSLSISSFGLFLMLGFLTAAFVCWRLAKTYDLSEEKILDLVILTFLGGLLGARIYFVVTHWSLFQDLGRAILLNRYPGLSFWGGLVGGALALKFFTSRTKLNFWQVADFGAVGLILGLALGDLGCFFGGCGYGVSSNLIIATSVVGLVGKRFPISVFESLALLFLFFYFYRQVVRFHFGGKIVSLTLMFLGVIKLITEFFRGDSQSLPYFSGISFGHIFSLALFGFGVVIFYRRSKRNYKNDLKAAEEVFTSAKRRETVLSKIGKNWYNHKVGLKVQIKKIGALRRKLNVKPTPAKFSKD